MNNGSKKMLDDGGKRVMLCLAAGMFLAVCVPSAYAQSSVTLYGIISTGLEYTTNVGGSHLISEANGPQQPARWGLKGKEDLGGGTSAIFQLENGFSITNGTLGQGGRMFGRLAWVGLSNREFGTVTLGRQYDEMTQQLYWAESAVQFAAFGTHIGDNDNIYNDVRFNNSVRYATVDYGGFSAAAQYAFSNATQFGNNRAYSAGATYTHGPFRIGVGMSQFDTPASTSNANGAVDSSGYGFTNPFVTSLGGKGTQQNRIFGVAADYQASFVHASFIYSNVLYNYLDSTGLRLQNIELSLTHYITPAFLIGASYTYTFGRYSSDQKPHYQQVDLGVDYFLSKKTDLFLTGIYQRAGGSAQYAEIFSVNPSSTKTQALVVSGIRVKF